MTDAYRKPEEINHGFQLGNGYVYLIGSALLSQPATQNLELLNRGVSGNTIEVMAERWQEDCLDLKPDLVSILIGVNNTIHAMKGQRPPMPKAFFQTYSDLIERTRAANPDCEILLLEPFLLETDIVTQEWLAHLKTYQEHFPDFADRMGVQYLPLQERFQSACTQAPAAHWLFDGIHATAPGARIIADAWLSWLAASGTQRTSRTTTPVLHLR